MIGAASQSVPDATMQAMPVALTFRAVQVPVSTETQISIVIVSVLTPRPSCASPNLIASAAAIFSREPHCCERAGNATTANAAAARIVLTFWVPFGFHFRRYQRQLALQCRSPNVQTQSAQKMDASRRSHARAQRD